MQFFRRSWLATSFLAALLVSTSAQSESMPRFGLTGPEIEVDLSVRNPATNRLRGAGPAPIMSSDRGAGRTYHFKPEDVDVTAGFNGAGGRGDAADAIEIGSNEGGQYRLNFERADIKDVVHAVLHDTLGINYTMGADVTGQITISSPRPLTREELLSSLETVLSGQGFALTRNGASYRIAPVALGSGPVSYGSNQQAGYGVSVIPLRYVSATVMSRLVSGFVADAEGLRFDTARNTMIVRGPGPKRQEAVSAILAFDADWMRGQSVSLFEVKRARPETVVAELTQLFDTGENGAGAGLIQFKPIARLRSVMAMSKNPALIRRAETFIRKLDGTVEAAEENVFIYKSRYRDARELARVVNGLFGNGSGSGNSGLGGNAASGLGGTGSGLNTSSSGSNQSRSGLGGSSQGGGAMNSGGGSLGSGGGSSGSGAGSQSGTELLKARFASAFGDTSSSGGMNDGGGMANGMAGGGETLDLTRRSGARRVSISVDPSNNSVVTYADGETYKKIYAALRQLDATPVQVAVNVTIAEVRLTDQLKYGVQYFLDSGKLGIGGNRGSFGLVSGAASAASTALQRTVPGFNFLVGGAAGPDIVISALDGFTDVKILSSPSLVVMENQPATLQVGDSVPITTRQAQSVDFSNAPLINQVEFRDTGIILNVIPRIGQNDAVTMQIEQEISAVVAAADTLTPTISKRRVASTISVASGQTVLLAGLISEKKQRGRSGIPFLDRLPQVGELFSSTDNAAERTELVVFIRPVVVRSGHDAQRVAEDYRGQLLDAGARRGARRASAPRVVK